MDELTKLYLQWYKELSEIAPHFSDDKYSNPYYMAIPKDWNQSDNKVMIVGEEGYGEKGCGKIQKWTMQKIQEWMLYYLNTQLNENKEDPDYNKSPFWRRIRKIKSPSTSFIWNNIDKIHSLQWNGGLKYKLSVSDRKTLHSTETKVLYEEIKIARPNIVVFFGWYGVSLRAELPSIYDKLYGNAKRITKKDVYVIEEDGIFYIFTWHPNRQPREYEEKVIAEIQKVMKQPTN